MLQWAVVGSSGARGIRHRSAKGLGDIHKVRLFGIYQVKGAHWIFEITGWLFHEENGSGFAFWFVNILDFDRNQ